MRSYPGPVGDVGDGIVAGEVFALRQALLQHAEQAPRLVLVSVDGRLNLLGEVQLVASRITEACDALDRIQDGLTFNLAACQKIFDWNSLLCRPEKSDRCLSEAKVEAAAPMVEMMG